MALTLSGRDARRVAIRAQRLDTPRPRGLADLVRDLTFLQVDLTAGGSTRKPTGRGQRGMPRRHPADLAGRGPASCARAARHHGRAVALERMDNDRNVGQLLELMAKRGEVAVSHRHGRERIWDLAERIFPDLPDVPEPQARRERDRRRLSSLGIVRDRRPDFAVEPADVGDAGEPAQIEGVRGRWRVDPAYLDDSFRGRTALLSPLDRLIFDRKRMADIFEFDYQLEMYKPAATRRWGYFALPILHGDRLVGKVDATTDREAGLLHVDAVHEDIAFSASLREAVHRELRSLAAMLRVEVSHTS